MVLKDSVIILLTSLMATKGPYISTILDIFVVLKGHQASVCEQQMHSVQTELMSYI
jgi:hypothetical protein